MASYNTTLSLVNLSGKAITQTVVNNVLVDEWDGDTYRPDKNFSGPLPNLSARCEREEIVRGAAGATFDLVITFDGGVSFTLSVNQRDAYTKQAGLYPTNLPASSGLEVWRETGESADAYTQAFIIRPKALPDHSGWMKALAARAPNVTMRELTMPGSHDAGMYVDNGSNATIHAAHEGGGDWALTQSLDFLGQLKAGVRYFDLRVYVDKADVQWAYHGQWKGAIFYGTFGGKLDDILADIATFMGTPGCKEAVFLKITPYVGADDYQATIDKVTDALGAWLYKTSDSATIDFATTPLATLAGKVIPAFTKEFKSLLSQSKGTYLYGGAKHHAPGNLSVYDDYADSNSFADMVDDQNQKLEGHGGFNNDYLFLYSWTLTGKIGGIMDLVLLGAAANPQLPRLTYAWKIEQFVKPNILSIDYVDAYICDAIISLNG